MAASAVASSFREVKVRIALHLYPSRMGNVRAGVEEVLDQLLLSHCVPVGGVVLSYSDVRLKDRLGLLLDGRPHAHFEAEAKLVVFAPKTGSALAGVVNKVGDDHVGLLVSGAFNVAVSAADMPEEYHFDYVNQRWVPQEGADDLLPELAVDTAVPVTVRGVQNTEDYFSIIGRLDRRALCGAAAGAVAGGDDTPVLGPRPRPRVHLPADGADDDGDQGGDGGGGHDAGNAAPKKKKKRRKSGAAADSDGEGHRPKKRRTAKAAE